MHAGRDDQEVDTRGAFADRWCMDSVVVRCAFCVTRHVIVLDDIDTWFAMCPCGARGFTEDEASIDDRLTERSGFTVSESATPDGRPILLADPIAVIVDGLCLRWYVLWYRLEDA